MPDQPTAERARVLGALAQVLMVDGSFDESAPAGRAGQGRRHDADPVADAELGHATCTLGVDIAYGGQIDRGWPTWRRPPAMRVVPDVSTT